MMKDVTDSKRINSRFNEEFEEVIYRIVKEGI